MHKSFIGLAAAASIGLTTMTAPSPANAWCWGCAVGAGILGGVAAGAIIGGAIAASPPPPYYYYRPVPPPPPPAYPPPPAAIYGAPPPAYAQLAPGCHWAKRRVWVEGVGYRVQSVQVCP